MSSQEALAIKYRPYTEGRTPWYKTVPHVREPDFPYDYKVPNLGEDREMEDTRTHMQNAEGRLKKKFNIEAYQKSLKPDEPDSYTVPNFG